MLTAGLPYVAKAVLINGTCRQRTRFSGMFSSLFNRLQRPPNQALPVRAILLKVIRSSANAGYFGPAYRPSPYGPTIAQA